MAEERSAKLRLENRILELEKHSSMMDCDYKQALQKLDELRRHKDNLTEEVGVRCVWIFKATDRYQTCHLFNIMDSVYMCDASRRGYYLSMHVMVITITWEKRLRLHSTHMNFSLPHVMRWFRD